jgi:hypothetical protein
MVRRCNDDADIAGITSSGDETQIICAVVEDLATGHGLILPIDIANELNTSLFVMPAVKDRQRAESMNCDGDNSTENDVINAVSCNDSRDGINADSMIENNGNDWSDIAKLIRTQQSDES